MTVVDLTSSVGCHRSGVCSGACTAAAALLPCSCASEDSAASPTLRKDEGVGVAPTTADAKPFWDESVPTEDPGVLLPSLSDAAGVGDLSGILRDAALLWASPLPPPPLPLMLLLLWEAWPLRSAEAAAAADDEQAAAAPDGAAATGSAAGLGPEGEAGGVMGAAGTASPTLLLLLRHCAPSSRAVPSVALEATDLGARTVPEGGGGGTSASQ